MPCSAHNTDPDVSFPDFGNGLGQLIGTTLFAACPTSEQALWPALLIDIEGITLNPNQVTLCSHGVQSGFCGPPLWAFTWGTFYSPHEPCIEAVHQIFVNTRPMQRAHMKAFGPRTTTAQPAIGSAAASHVQNSEVALIFDRHLSSLRVRGLWWPVL